MTFRDTVRRLRREQMLQATREALARAGCYALQVKDVATSAALSRTSIYGEFGNKEALIDAALASAVDELLPRLEAELAQPGNPGVVAAIALLAERAEEGRSRGWSLPCCLQQPNCPWQHWRRLEDRLTTALDASAADPQDETRPVVALIRPILCVLAHDQGAEFDREDALRVLRSALSLPGA